MFNILRPSMIRMRRFILLAWMIVFLGFGLLQPSTAFSEELTIAAASDLNFAFKELVAGFERETGIDVKLSLGSSGNFFAQIQNGAPFDLYFSADVGFPKKLEETGLVVPGSLYRYAIGRIVVWVRNQSPVAVEREGIRALLDPSFKKIAIANPKHAPYGRAAVAALRHYKLYDAVKDKLVLGENISQAAQFVESGAADAGVIALSLALAPSMKDAGKHWEIPAEAHPSLDQGAVILKGSTHQEAARKFIEYLRRAEGREVMRRYGFVLPDEAPAK